MTSFTVADAKSTRLHQPDNNNISYIYIYYHFLESKYLQVQMDVV